MADQQNNPPANQGGPFGNFQVIIGHTGLTASQQPGNSTPTPSVSISQMAPNQPTRPESLEPSLKLGDEGRPIAECPENTLIAYQCCDTSQPIQRAQPQRQWMDQTRDRFAYRCLPLTIANQHGWELLNPTPFRVYWDGGQAPENLHFEWPEGKPDSWITGHFGEGVLTFSLAFLFRTPVGVNLYVKGPVNRYKDGIHALEGIVETDWLTATFTMNWKLTRTNNWVEFHQDEPICHIFPIARGTIDQFEPEIRMMTDDPEMLEAFNAWSRSRSSFLKDLKVEGSEARRQGWQKEYFQGAADQGIRWSQHQTHLSVKEFADKRGQEIPRRPTPDDAGK
ncbi:hypothetical protein Pan216_51440 [Planctomycetes bacterium Pan216]|uniref:Uncharacterized protein n=1 Tax=Kolteria novifilia TaxID=2527975 RepID=A0A518BB95_9BACT|nr:hypothetical protein Pan216_51440 [Planctomycetes bacterium Pan216]